jgi:hypothetical protein
MYLYGSSSSEALVALPLSVVLLVPARALIASIAVKVTKQALTSVTSSFSFNLGT